MTDFQPVVDEIKLIMVDSLLTDEFYTDLLKRLESIGYVATKTDAWMLSFSIQKVENDIKSECNTASIPDGLYFVAIDMICGEFLFSKKQSGTLVGFEIEQAIKAVQIGDTNVQFGSSDSSSHFDMLITFLRMNGRGEFASYRKVRW